MDRYRLIASIVVLFIYLFAMYPLQTFLFAILIILGYFWIKNLNSNSINRNGDSMRRKRALREAKIYLAPYDNIWRNLKLSNKYCVLRLGLDGQTIKAYDIASNRSFKVVKSRVHELNDLWDMFCIGFSHNTTFDGLVQQCEKFNVDIVLNGVQNNTQQLYNNQYKTNVDIYPKENSESIIKEKLDINNASEVELTALPGVSIVLAKKIIKKREEIGGFKSVNDLFLFLNLKPHLKTQLENLICVKKMNGFVNLKRFEERHIDL